MARHLNRKAFVLRVNPSRVDRMQEALESKEIIIGWSKARGLTGKGLSGERFWQIVYDTYYKRGGSRKCGAAVGSLWRFIRDMNEGDWVVVPHGGEFYIAEVSGEAYHDESKVSDDTAHRRPVNWLNNGRAIPRSYARAALQSRMKARQTCVAARDLLEEIQEVLRTVERKERPTFEDDLRQRLIEETRKEICSGRLDSFGFERLVKTLLQSLGATEVQIIPRKSDRGVDILADFSVAKTFNFRLAVQAKHFKPEPPVGAGVVEQLVRGMDVEDAQSGWVITSGNFSEGAKRRAEELQEKRGLRIELVDGEQLAALIVEAGLRLGRES